MTIALVALAMTSFLLIVALVVDLGYVRGTARIEQSVADMAALAAGKGLAAGDPLQSCQDAISYVNANAKGMPAISASNFCTQAGNDVRSTVCSGGSLTQAAPSVRSGRYTVTIHYPVPDAEIADPRWSGPGLNDKKPCNRFRVIISATDVSFFSGVAGVKSYRTTRTATSVAVKSKILRTPALWLLDPVGCTLLNTTGGADVEVGTSTVAGVVVLDSDSSTCGGSKYTLNVSGSGTRVRALDGSTSGYIGLYALPPGATTCTGHACDPANVSSGVLSPQPVSSGERATRAPVDWRYNCKASYPAFPALQTPKAVYTEDGCPDTSVRGPYIDQLRASLAGAASAAPSGFQTITDCAPAGTQTFVGNYWVNCPGGYSIGNGTNVSFAGGNVIFTGDVQMSGGGNLAINSTISDPGPPATFDDTSNVGALPGNCATPGVGSPCLTASSQQAAFAYFVRGGLNFSGGTFHANHTAIVMSTATGSVKITGGAPPTWTAPTEGPFAALALWAEGMDGGPQPFQINGGAGVKLAGAFFTPEATMTLSGGGDWQLPQDAQFIAFRLSVTGGGVLRLSPDPATAVSAPPSIGVLIR